MTLVKTEYVEYKPRPEYSDYKVTLELPNGKHIQVLIPVRAETWDVDEYGLNLVTEGHYE